MSDGDHPVKDALDQEVELVTAGPEAPKLATCPDCGGIVDLRSRRAEKNLNERTWYYRHRRGQGRQCLRRVRTGW